MNKSPNHIEDFFGRVRRRRIMKRFGLALLYLILFVLFLLGLIWVLVQNEKVQNWAAKKATNFLSEELQTKVEVDRLEVEFFNSLVLKGLYVEDLNGDTLLYSGEITSSLSANLVALLDRDLDIDEIQLKDTRLFIRRDTGQYDNNLKQVLNNIIKPKKKKTKKSSSKPFFLDIDDIYFSNLHFIEDDKVDGEVLDVFLPTGHFKVDDIDLEKNKFELGLVEVDAPVILFEDHQDYPLPPRPKMVILEPVDSTEAQIFDTTDISYPLLIKVHDVVLKDGIFDLHNYRKAPVKTTPEDRLDWKHLSVLDIQIDADSFVFTEGEYTAQDLHIACRESSGFVLDKLDAGNAVVSNRAIKLYDLDLITPYSSVGDTLILKYRKFKDLKDFNDRVIMQAYFNDSKIAIQDILVFAPNLKNNKFFKQNAGEVFEIDGYVSGKVNSLKGKNINMKLGSSTTFKGNFSSRNIAVRNEEIVNLNLERLLTDVKTLRLLVPGFNPPANFDKLGTIDFSGKFDGFFVDFVAFGKLKTDLGVAEMDMGLDLSKGRDLATYNGRLNLIDFDLQKWSDNKNLGKITISAEVKQGQGLNLETVNAQGSGKIDQFDFRGYQYRNIEMDGLLTQNFFEGFLSVKDDNTDLVFDGSINNRDSIPKFDFKANVNKIDLGKLNLSKQDIVVSGILDLKLDGKDLSTINIDSRAFDLELIHNGTDRYHLDSLDLESSINAKGFRNLSLNSDVAIASIDGVYDIQELPETILQFLERNFTAITDRFNIKSKNKEIKPSKFNFDLEIIDSRNFANLLDTKMDTIRQAKFKGSFDGITDQLKLNAKVPFIFYDHTKFEDIELDIMTDEGYAEIEAGIANTTIQDEIYEPFSFNGVLQNDTLKFGLNSNIFTKKNNLLDDINLNGELFFSDEFFQVRMLTSNLELLSNQWEIAEDNYIRFGKGFIETNNFDLTSDNKRIVLRSIGERGLALDLENVRLSLIDEFWDYSKLDFDGRININATVDDIFKLEGVRAIAVADTLEVNGDDWGVLRLTAEMENTSQPVDVYMSITRGEEQLTAEGFFGPLKKGAPRLSDNDYELDLNINTFPLYIAEYWIGNGVSNTLGTFDADVHLEGRLKQKPNISGTFSVTDLAITIDYLQTRYRMESGSATISNSMFDASGARLQDELGNYATIQGGLAHDHLKNLRPSASITSDEFLFLNTTLEDNDLYYGTAIGGGTVRFAGTFPQTEIFIDATTGDNTKLNIPVTDERNSGEVTFITYVDKDKKVEEEEDRSSKELRGVNVEMFLNITEAAEVFIIFDERAGDKIQGIGAGDVRLSVSRSGEIEMYGDYLISEGKYLFTLLNLVNKPFEVKKGGTISWNGDPFDATINLEAVYSSTTPLSTFLSEYTSGVGGSDIETLARTSAQVDLIMSLTGALLSPDIEFDLRFPNVKPELRNFVESRLSILRQDQNELNRQVFGLMVVGSFLPSGDDALSGRQGLITFNTVTEMLSNQLSIYLTELLSDVFSDVGFISGVNFDINYSVYEADEIDPDGQEIVRTGSELELRLRNDLFNDRLSINVGGNIDWGNNNGISTAQNQGAFLAGDVVIEYTLTKDRRFKVRFYQLTDQTFEGRRNKTGLGFSYRREFDSFNEFIGNMKKTALKAADSD